MPNGDPIWHVTRAIDDLRTDLRDTRTEIGELRGELSETRETVARIQGAQEGEAHHVERSHRLRDQAIAITAALGVILGAVATIHPF